jgi:RimJ/RimL family protein N-acetyltransferase
MSFVSFRTLDSSDADNISKLLLGSSSDYSKHFDPFDFRAPFIRKKLESAIKDRYFGMQLESSDSNDTNLVGFYMLRGMDEGYHDPMYGVFISEYWNSKGIARLSLFHAECFCKLNSYKRLLLKVKSDNYKALTLYQSCGFNASEHDRKVGNLYLYKDL